ncbi:hypothetical protein MP228_008189 [Amoeboaphelidium protococcarum]|nr:hypothetical protein MP228_008189 [Amoeboaphelidium protococcarum]
MQEQQEQTSSSSQQQQQQSSQSSFQQSSQQSQEQQAATSGMQMINGKPMIVMDGSQRSKELLGDALEAGIKGGAAAGGGSPPQRAQPQPPAPIAPPPQTWQAPSPAPIAPPPQTWQAQPPAAVLPPVPATPPPPQPPVVNEQQNPAASNPGPQRTNPSSPPDSDSAVQTPRRSARVRSGTARPITPAASQVRQTPTPSAQSPPSAQTPPSEPSPSPSPSPSAIQPTPAPARSSAPSISPVASNPSPSPASRTAAAAQSPGAVSAQEMQSRTPIGQVQSVTRNPLPSNTVPSVASSINAGNPGASQQTQRPSQTVQQIQTAFPERSNIPSEQQRTSQNSDQNASARSQIGASQQQTATDARVQPTQTPSQSAEDAGNRFSNTPSSLDDNLTLRDNATLSDRDDARGQSFSNASDINSTGPAFNNQSAMQFEDDNQFNQSTNLTSSLINAGNNTKDVVSPLNATQPTNGTRRSNATAWQPEDSSVEYEYSFSNGVAVPTSSDVQDKSASGNASDTTQKSDDIISPEVQNYPAQYSAIMPAKVDDNKRDAFFSAPENKQVVEQAAAQPNNGLIQKGRPGLQVDGNAAAYQQKAFESMDQMDALPESTEQGERVRNLLPSSEGYDGMALSKSPDLPLLVIAFKLKCGDVCSNPSGPERASFEKSFKDDLVNSLSQFNISTSNVEVLNVAQVLQVTAVQFTISPADDSQDAMAIADAVRALINDRNSTLYKGQVTRSINPNVFSSELMRPMSNSERFSPNGKTLIIFVVFITVGLYCALMTVYVFAYRAYKKRLHDDQIRLAKERTQLKSWYYKDLRIDPSHYQMQGEDGSDCDSFMDGIQDGDDYLSWRSDQFSSMRSSQFQDNDTSPINAGSRLSTPGQLEGRSSRDSHASFHSNYNMV